MEGRESRRMVQTPVESRIRIPLRRPLFAALAGAVTIVWIIVMQILAASAPADRAEAVLYRVKRSLSDVIDRVFSERNAPVLRALLLGEKGLLEEETRELYQGAGILHIQSISGVTLGCMLICGIP